MLLESQHATSARQGMPTPNALSCRSWSGSNSAWALAICIHHACCVRCLLQALHRLDAAHAKGCIMCAANPAKTWITGTGSDHGSSHPGLHQSAPPSLEAPQSLDPVSSLIYCQKP